MEVAHADFRAAGELQAGTQTIFELELAAHVLIAQVGLGEIGGADTAFQKGRHAAVTGTETQAKHGCERQAGGIQAAPAGHAGIPVTIQLHPAGLALPQGAAKLELRSDPVGSGVLR